MSDPPRFSDCTAAYAWLDAQIDYERVLDRVRYDARAFEVEGFRRRLHALGDPHRGLATVHIAGTRGKGSAALALEALLQASGLRTAVYLSPHLREYRERIRIDGRPLAPERFATLLAPIAGLAEAVPDPVKVPFKTVFECLTALFFLAARDARVDWAVVETGLGGRLDATNVLDPGPVLWTRIGLEHTHLLGDTVEAIAGEKAAILKPGGWAVLGAQAPDGRARSVFVARARACEADLIDATQACPIRRCEPHRDGLRLTIEFEGQPLAWDSALFGDFHAENLQNALAMVAELRRRGCIPRVEPARLRRALERLVLPGRLERVARDPDWLVDGGHDPTAARALARAMAAHFGAEPADLVVGMMADKRHREFFAALAQWPHWRSVRCYRIDSPRAAPAEALARAAAPYFGPRCPILAMSDLAHALESLGTDAEKPCRVVVTGSLYSVARAQDWGAVRWPSGRVKFERDAS